MDTIVIFCAFTRRWAIDKWIEGFEALSYPKELMSLVFVVDCDEPYIFNKLMALGKRGYLTCQVVMNTDHAPNEVRISARRLRIADVKNDTKQLVAAMDGEFVVAFEDDTIFMQTDVIERLLAPFRELPNVGYVEGVQCGRWGAKVIGAWQVDDVQNPAAARTIMPPEGNKNVWGEIDGGGFYGYATRKTHYVEHSYHWTGEPWGPDVNYGLWLRRKRYSCIIDWGVVFGHNDYNSLLLPDKSVTEVVYNLDKNTNQWGRQADAYQSR